MYGQNIVILVITGGHFDLPKGVVQEHMEYDFMQEGPMSLYISSNGLLVQSR